MRAGIEAGGTKIVVGTGTGPLDLVVRAVVPTTTPERTLEAVNEVLWQAETDQDEAIDAVGLAWFGPLDLDARSPGYGTVTTTPKPDWAGTDLLNWVRQDLRLPAALDTDVAGAALGEHRWGAALGTRSSVYLTAGTGIGGAAVLDGRPLRGLMHPEMGHLPVQRHPADPTPGTCPFHGGDCVEGRASGAAVRARAGRPGEQLADAPDLLAAAVEIEAWYLAQLVTSVAYLLSPERVVLGGGVLGLPGLLDAVRVETHRRLARALAAPSGDLSDYLVTPALGSSSGVLGALALAERALVEAG